MTRILIVEDEAGLRQGLEINLRHENYETVTAADGEEAIRLFHAESPDLVLLDLMLPKKSGFEVLERMPRNGNPPSFFSSTIDLRAASSASARCSSLHTVRRTVSGSE